MTMQKDRRLITIQSKTYERLERLKSKAKRLSFDMVITKLLDKRGN